MYLSRLSDEAKELFLDLSIYAAQANEEVNDLEKGVIDAYCKEMDLPKSEYKAKYSLDEVLEKLKACTAQEKNIIFIEILALLGADDIYDVLEKKFINTLQKTLEYENGRLFEIIYALRQLKETQKFFEQIIQN